MKKNVLILSALCFATMTLVFSGCKKENNDPQEPAQLQSYKMSITATKGGADTDEANGPRRVISLGAGGTTLTATWAAEEAVTVHNNTKNADLTGTLTAQSAGATVQLNGTLTGGTIEAGDELLLKYLSPNYAGQTGTLEHISANCDYATATVTVSSLDGENIYTDGTATFENQQAIVKFTLKNEDGSATIDAKPLVIKVGDDTYTITPESATSEMYVALPGFTSQNITFTATAGSDTYKKTVTGESLTNGEFYQITVKMTKQAPAYKEYGPFSVGPADNNKQVYFSQGNLQYTISTNKFSFMDNQYDMVETNGDVGTDYASQDVISLFGWATSNLNTPANTYYYPWETDNSDGAKYGSGITTSGVNWSDNENAFANYDWGANTGDLGTGWRTLTNDEWVYLFDTRIVNGGTGNGNSYTVGKSVNGIKGVVLYPDNYTGATYTGSDWSTFEDAGCVFLPAAGSRDGTSVSEVGSEGYYWSSTSNSDQFAHIVYFVGGNVSPEGSSSYRYYGRSVRLVKNVE